MVVQARAADESRCEVGGAVVTAHLIDPNGAECEAPRVIDRGDGTYVVAFLCPSPGEHHLHIEMQSTPSGPVESVGDSPYALKCS